MQTSFQRRRDLEKPPPPYGGGGFCHPSAWGQTPFWNMRRS